ncbi:MAG: alpha/beta hydrolase, partial [Acidobacteriota bacterium]
MRSNPPRPHAVLATVLCLAVTAGLPAVAIQPPSESDSERSEDPEPAPEPASEAAPDWAALAAERLPLLEPCELPGIDEPVLCGTVDVAEDRSRTDGRRIGLHVVVLPAHAEDPPGDAITVLAGGPGGAATVRAAGLAHVAPLRTRDVVLFDQRGTGASHPLDCDLGARADGLAELPEMFPPEEVRACAEALSRTADLDLYTTVHHADDLEELRRRLGYESLNVRGGSYGTLAAMVFAQRHPESTRTLFLIGVDSPLRSNLAERGLWTDRTLAGIALQCARRPDCARIAPRLERMVAELFDRLEEGPVRVEVPLETGLQIGLELAGPAETADPAGTSRDTLTLDVGRDWLGEQVRLLLYYGFSSRALPWAVHRAHAADDWEPITRLGLFIDRMFRSTLADGVLLTVQCSEHMSFDADRALAQGATTLFGNYRLEQQLQGCAAWPHRKTDLRLGVARPRPLPIPTVLVSGAWDPVTPPAYAEDATAYFPAYRHLILDEGQHGPFDLEGGWVCVHQIWADLIDRESLDGLDASCTDELHRQPFLVDREAFDDYFAETLA